MIQELHTHIFRGLPTAEKPNGNGTEQFELPSPELAPPEGLPSSCSEPLL